MKFQKVNSLVTRLALIAALSLLLIGPAAASSIDITATLTADNHYGLYVGDASGSSLTFIGRNEPADTGNPGGSNWSLPETWTASVSSDHYLYVLAWNVDSPQMWIGQFQKSNGSTLYSNTTDWLYTVARGPNPSSAPTADYPEGALPAIATVQSDIAYANNTSGGWARPQASAPNDGNQIWSSDPDNNLGIPGIAAAAKFIWHDTFSGDGDLSSSQDYYAIFRSAAPVGATPIPGSVLLLGTGLLGLALLGKPWTIKRRLSKN